MKHNTTNRKAGVLLLAMMMLLLACDKQGPMGPEGPPGPDGQNANSGGSSFTTYMTADNARIRWRGLDGWGGYLIADLQINEDYLQLPDSAISMIEDGGLVLAYVKMNNAWRRLPFKEGLNNETGFYKYYMDYVVFENEVRILIRAQGANNDDDMQAYPIERVKVVVAPASSVVSLKP